MRISDWSSDVCSSDLDTLGAARGGGRRFFAAPCEKLVDLVDPRFQLGNFLVRKWLHVTMPLGSHISGRHVIPERKSVVEGKSVAVSVDIGGRRILKYKKQHI